MKILECKKVLAALLMASSIGANAGIIVVSGNSFDDLGGSTVDLQTSLEWRDMHLTNGRSQCSVAQDTGGPIPAGCSEFDGLNLIDDADGWRYATRSEVAALLTNWMGVPVPSDGEATVDAGLNEQFRSVFADGFAEIRPDFLQDAFNPIQAVGFFSADTQVRTSFLNGNINDSCCGQGSALVRGESVPVPAPATLPLMILALAGLSFARRRGLTPL